jgi:outer membrane protein OmpA-like peptidoglycan-associated protein
MEELSRPATRATPCWQFLQNLSYLFGTTNFPMKTLFAPASALVAAAILLLLLTPGLPAQDIVPADQLARKWKRTKSLVEPKEEIRRTKGVSLEIVEVKVDADTEERFPNLQFALNSDHLDGAVTFSQLAEIAKAMKMAGSEKFLIEGHTCDLGAEEHNKTLSQRRAAAVVAELVRLGVPGERMQPLGFGQEHPLVENSTELSRQQNRRVQIFRKL